MAASLLPRAWKSIAPSARACRFKLLSFNMLADGLAQFGEFINCPPSALEWSYRKELILQEIRRADPDVLALQELNHAPEIQLHLKEEGYEGMWLSKVSSPALQFGAPPDGVGLFWRKARFEALGKGAQGEYFTRLPSLDAGGIPSMMTADVSIDLPTGNGNGNNGNGGSHGSSGFLYVLLRDRQVADEKGLFLVCTSHLKAKAGPENDLIRLDQASQIRSHLESVRPSPEVPVLLCGDMNTEPSSAPIQHFLEGPLGLQSLWRAEAWGLEGESAGAIPSTSSDGASYEVPWAPGLFSTWKYRPGKPGEAKLTPEGWKESKRIIDFCLLAKGTGRARLEPVEFLSLPTAEAIGKGGLPTLQYPSDHIAIGFGFEWRESD